MAGILKELGHLAKHSAVYGLSNVLGKAIGFLLIPLYTHYIPPADYGTLELLDLSINIVGMFVGMGLAAAVGKFYYDNDDVEERNRVVSSALIVLIVLAAAMVLLCWPFSSFIARVVLDNGQLAGYVKISLLTFALNAVLEIPLTYIRAREKSVFFSVIALSRLALSLALNVYFIVVLNLGILGILYSGLITSSVLIVVLLYWCVKDVGFALDKKLAWAMILFGAPLIMNSLGMFVINFGDRFVLKSVVTLADVGVYSLGYKIGMGLMSFLVGQPFFLIWSVRRYSLVKEEGGLEKYGQIFLLYILLLLTVWLLLSAFSKEMIMLLAPVEYRGASIILPLIALGYLFREMSDFFRGAFMIKNKTHMIGGITGVVTAYCIMNYLILIPMYQELGAAIATVSTFLFMAIVNGYFAQKIMPVEYKILRIVILILFYVLLAGVCNYISGDTISVWIVFVKLLLICSACFVSFFIAFRRDERVHIIEFVKEAVGPKIGLKQ